jgi:hypothetical protein
MVLMTIGRPSTLIRCAEYKAQLEAAAKEGKLAAEV